MSTSTLSAPRGQFNRRLFALLMILALLPLMPPGGLAQEETPGNLFGSSLLDGDAYLTSMALAGDALYFSTHTDIYSYSPGDSRAVWRAKIAESAGESFRIINEDEEAGYEPVISVLVSDGTTLYGLEKTQQTLYTLGFEGEKLVLSNPLKLDLSNFILGEEPYKYLETPSWMLIMDGRIYMKMLNYEGKPEDLYSFDLKTGEKKAHTVTHLQAASPYKDGTLIVAQSDPTDMYDMETGKMRLPELAIFNPGDDSLTKTGAFLPAPSYSGVIPGICYSAEDDALFTYSDTDVYRLDGDMKTARLIGYLPMYEQFQIVPNGIQLLPGGRLAIAFGTNAFIRERTEKGLEDMIVLTISGSLMDGGGGNIINRVLMEMDKVVLRRVDGVEWNYISAEQLASMFLTGNVPADIMAINAYGFDLDKLIAKGYLEDLSGSEKIRAYMDTVAPNLRESFVVDGKIYTIPSSIILMPTNINPKAFENLKLEAPGSVMDIIDLTEQWADGLAEEHPEYMLFSESGNGLKDTLRRYVISQYVSNTLGAGNELTFDTPVFRKLMERLNSISYGDLDRVIDWESESGRAEMEEMWNKVPLIETNMGFEPRYIASQRQYSADRPSQVLVLPLEDDQEARLEADFNLLVLLSSSKNKETAIRFIEHIIDKMDPVDKAALNPQANEPIENPDFDKQMAEYAKQVKRLEEMLAKAEGAEKSNLEQNLAYMKEWQGQMLESGKFLATEDDLKTIHGVISHLYILTGLGNAQRQAFFESYEVLEQYFAGTINLDQFVRQMDDKLRLLRMEYQ